MNAKNGWRSQRARVTFDMVLGAAVFGIVGAAIGYYLNTTGSIFMAGAIGTVFGFMIGLLGGRRFFVSIICGALIGGALAALIAGRQAIPLGAGSGGAMGGFIGVQLGMLLDLWRQRKASVRSEPPADPPPEPTITGGGPVRLDSPPEPTDTRRS